MPKIAVTTTTAANNADTTYARRDQVVVSRSGSMVEKSTAVAPVSGFYRNAVTGSRAAGKESVRVSVTIRESAATERLVRANRVVFGKSDPKK